MSLLCYIFWDLDPANAPATKTCAAENYECQNQAHAYRLSHTRWHFDVLHALQLMHCSYIVICRCITPAGCCKSLPTARNATAPILLIQEGAVLVTGRRWSRKRVFHECTRYQWRTHGYNVNTFLVFPNLCERVTAINPNVPEELCFFKAMDI